MMPWRWKDRSILSPHSSLGANSSSLGVVCGHFASRWLVDGQGTSNRSDQSLSTILSMSRTRLIDIAWDVSLFICGGPPKHQKCLVCVFYISWHAFVSKENSKPLRPPNDKPGIIVTHYSIYLGDSFFDLSILSRMAVGRNADHDAEEASKLVPKNIWAAYYSYTS